MRTPTILVIDSGVGGLSVTQHIRLKCPSATITYIADTLYFPYGQKAEEIVIQRIHTLVRYGLCDIQPDLVVIACNTASTVALESLRETFSVPFVGVVPAIKPAAQNSASGIIGVLATRGTVNGLYTRNLISSFAQGNGVFLHGSSLLVETAEQKLQGVAPCLQRIQEDVNKLLCQHKEIDTVVLACTHFPLLKAEFQECFPKIKSWIDSGDAIARRVEFLLAEMGLHATDNFSNDTLAPSNRFMTTTSALHCYQQALITPLLGTHTLAMIDI